MKVHDLISMHDANFVYFDELWRKAEENERYKVVEHWTPEEKADIESQGREAYSIALISQKVNQILSAQKRNRVEWKLEATIDPLDEVKAELGTIQFKDLEHRSKMPYLESEVFDSGVAVCYGVAGIYLKDGVPNLREIDYKDFVWDANAKTYTKNDSVFMAELRKMYRFQLADEYGQKKARRANRTNDWWGRKNIAYYEVRNQDADLDIVTVFHHYQRVIRNYYVVLFNDYAGFSGAQGILEEEFKTKKEAESYLRELKLLYLEKDLPLGNHSLERVGKPRLDYYEFTCDEILKKEETELEDFPYAIYQAYHFKDKIWTLTDVLKSVQKFVDRYIAQIDYSLGVDIKNVYEVAVNQIADGHTFEDVVEKINSDGIIPVKMAGAVKGVPSQGANPQYLQMTQVMVGFLEDLSGGRSFQGLAESSRESGVAIKEKKEAGSMVAALFLDNLARWRQDLGEKLLWWFKNYDTEERVVKIGGGELTPEMMQFLQSQGIFKPSVKTEGGGFVKVNSEMLHLKDAKLELKVSEERLSENQREKKLTQLYGMGQINPNLNNVPEFNMLMMEYSGVNYSDRQKIIKGYQNWLQAQAEAAQREQQLKEKELDIKKADLLINQDIEEKKIASQKKEKAKS